MSMCTDYWCEHYGKGNEKCDRCIKQDNPKEKPELRVIRKRRADKLMELTEQATNDKNKRQTR